MVRASKEATGVPSEVWRGQHPASPPPKYNSQAASLGARSSSHSSPTASAATLDSKPEKGALRVRPGCAQICATGGGEYRNQAASLAGPRTSGSAGGEGEQGHRPWPARAGPVWEDTATQMRSGRRSCRRGPPRRHGKFPRFSQPCRQSWKSRPFPSGFPRTRPEFGVVFLENNIYF